MNKRTKYTSGKRTMVWMAGMLLSAQVFAQDLTVKGHVKDETGEPVIGANVIIKGTSIGKPKVPFPILTETLYFPV